jgi:hypothetical protein
MAATGPGDGRAGKGQSRYRGLITQGKSDRSPPLRTSARGPVFGFGLAHTSPLLHWPSQPWSHGGNMHRSSAGTRLRSEPASGWLGGSAGRRQASGGGRWRAALARRPRFALFGIGLGIAVVAGVMIITLSGHSVRSGAGGCGLVVCGSTLPPSGPTTTPHRRQPTNTATPGPVPSPVSQIASAATPRGPGRRPGTPAQHPTHDHPTHPAHPTPPSPSQLTSPPRPTPTPTTSTTGVLPSAMCNRTK